VLEQEIWFSKASKELKSFEPVFKKLKSVHKALIDRDARHGWLYSFFSERPHVGHLAAAVWLSRGFALEEYGTHKINAGELKRGRCDLRIGIKKTVFECEAKSLWLNIGPKKDFVLEIKRKLDLAQKDCKKIRSKKRLALCFITPVIRKSKINEFYERRDKLIKSIKSSCDSLVWIGVKKAFNKRQIFFSGKYFYPGLLLAIKEV
jgi:hypothetical protein